jgi:hypothetical protein
MINGKNAWKDWQPEVMAIRNTIEAEIEEGRRP